MTLEALDRQSVVPLYYQIQQHLLAQVRSGALKSGQRVASEKELSERLNVSRMTARQALKSLCELGVVYSQRGKGTFVSAINLEKDFRQVLSFTEEMQKRGARPGSKVLSFAISPASAEVAEALRLSPTEKVIRLRRVRMANSLALGVECTHIPAALCSDFIKNYDPHTSLYRALASRYGIEIAITDEVAEAGLAKTDEARLLRISKGSPVFLFTRTSYVLSGKPVEFVKSVYRADRYKIVNRLTRLKATSSTGDN